MGEPPHVSVQLYGGMNRAAVSNTAHFSRGCGCIVVMVQKSVVKQQRGNQNNNRRRNVQ